MVPDQPGAGEPAHPDRRRPRRRHRLEQRQHRTGHRPRSALLRRSSTSASAAWAPGTASTSPTGEVDPDQQLTDDPGLDPQRHAGRRGGARRRRPRAAVALPLAPARLQRPPAPPPGRGDRRGRRAVPAGHARAQPRRPPPEVRRHPVRRRPDPRRRLRRRDRPVPRPARRPRPPTATRRRWSSPRPTARPRPGTTSRWPSRARRSTTSRRRSANAGRTAPRSPSTPGGCCRAGSTGRTCPPSRWATSAPPPPPRPDGHDVVQIVRTFPVILPKGFDFAPEGERSVMLGNTKAIAQADRLVYVEDQYLWSSEVGEHFAAALRDKPDLRLVVVLPMVPDREGALAEVPQLYGRSLAMRTIIEAGRRPGRGLRPVQRGRAARSTCTPRPASSTTAGPASGSDNLNRRSWTGDSEIACTVVDDARRPRRAGPRGRLPPRAAPHPGRRAPGLRARRRARGPARALRRDGGLRRRPRRVVRRRQPRRAERHPGPARWAGCRTASHRSPARWRRTSRVTSSDANGCAAAPSACRRPADVLPAGCAGWRHRS